MHYVGFDLHKRYVTVCALNKSGEVVAEYRRLSNTAETVGQRASLALRSFRGAFAPDAVSGWVMTRSGHINNNQPSLIRFIFNSIKTALSAEMDQHRQT
jgi:hypothetical protein